MIDVRCAHHAAQPRQDLLLGVGVHRRQRIVEDQDPRVDEQRAREGRPLLLAARQRDAALADHRVVALRERRDVLVEPRDAAAAARGSAPASRRPSSPPPTPNAMLSAIVSENRNGSCGTKPMAPRSTRERQVAHVHAVDEHRARRRVVQPRQQADQRGLARPGRRRRAPPSGPRSMRDATRRRAPAGPP